MIIERVESLEGLQHLEPEWSTLHRSCPRATPFQSPQWLLPWTRHLFGGGEIWALCFLEQGELIGFAPLFCWGTEHRTISFLGAGISDYGDLLFRPGREQDCVAALWEFLDHNRVHWDALDLQEVRSGSNLVSGRKAEECSICPVLELSSYPGTMDHKHRTDVRRAQNKLKKNFHLQFETTDQANLSRNMDEFFRLHETRWGAMGERIRAFHKEAASAFLAAGLLKLTLLEIDQKPAAAIYGFTAGQTLYCYLSGFDPALAKLSPGAVLLAWTIECAIEDGIKEVDFLRQTEAYKYLWGAKDRINYRLT